MVSPETYYAGAGQVIELLGLLVCAGRSRLCIGLVLDILVGVQLVSIWSNICRTPS